MKTGWSVEENYFPTIPTLINNLYGKRVTKKSQIILKRPIIKEEWKLEKDDIVLNKEIGQVCFVLQKKLYRLKSHLNS